MTANGSRFYEDPVAADILVKNLQPRRGLFLDRDGVINVDRGYVHRAESTEWLPGIFDLCGSIANAGFVIVVITNQAGIARGLYSEAQFLDYTRWVHDTFRRLGATLLCTYYCPHHPSAGVGTLLTDCRCRKPRPGMLLDAAERYGIILEESVLIGNKESDIEAGSAAGVACNLLLDDAEKGHEPANPGSSYVRTLEEAERVIRRMKTDA